MAPEGSGPTRDERRAVARQHIDRSIFTKIRIYLIVFLAVLVAAVVDTVQGTAWTWAFLAGGLFAGTLLGIFAARMQTYEWVDFERRVVARFDVVGVVVLIVYIVFAINRSDIVGAWVPAQHAPATSLGVMAGAMFGQVLGVHHGLLNLRRRLAGRQPPAPVVDG